MVNSLIANHPRSISGRAARNTLGHALIGSFLLIFLAPFVLVMSYIITAGLYETGKVGSQVVTGLMRFGQSRNKPVSMQNTQSPTVQTSDRSAILRIMPVTVDLLSAAMFILLWGMSSRTTINLLARTGARPARAGGPGAEAARALTMLSARAGIDRPKLYIVNCGFPTSFSVSTDVHHNLVAVTTGALDLLDQPEMEALLAHEVAHLVNRDSRLETILSSLEAITEYPARMFQKTLSDPNTKGLTRNIALLEMVLSPFGLYIFLVSPILNGLIRALVLRSRDFSADSHAALLTGNPEAVASALAKIGGVVTVVGKSTVASLPSHTSLTQRIERLMMSFAAHGYKGIAQAIAKGKQYARERPGIGQDHPGLSGYENAPSGIDQLPMTGRVHQLVSREPIPVFDRVGRGAPVRARLQPGALMVVFDTPGPMRQVNTAAGVFGYIGRDVKLKAVEGILPQELFEPGACEELLKREQEFTSQNAAALHIGLTRQQWWLALGFGTAVFAGTTMLLWH